MNPFQTRQESLVSFDGGVRAESVVARPDKLRFWQGWGGAADDRVTIARGAGLSYAAASFGGGATSIEHRAFNRLIDYDEATGELTVEAGADLWTCQSFLIPHGRYLPCHPGHGRITIGGCIAVDAHGKNPLRDGTFADHVRALTLMHPAHGILYCDRQRQPELLELTCGGLGLTGHVLTATLATRALPSSWLTLRRDRHADAEAAFAALVDAAERSAFAYSWHDLSGADGPHHVFSASTSQQPESSPPPRPDQPPSLSAAGVRRLPVNLVNRTSVLALNLAYRWKTRGFAGDGRTIGILEAAFPIHGSETYFALYGRRGFHEYQALVPAERAAAFLDQVRAMARRRGVAIALCSGKAFGGTPRYLRFAGQGIAIAFNFPRDAKGAGLAADIDGALPGYAGRPYLAKDSRLPAAVARKCYPQYEAFRSDLAQFDPIRRMRSDLSKRLAL